MPDLSDKEREHIDSAFELAYFIIPDKGIAVGVAEESWQVLDSMLGKRERTRRTYRQLLGFVKWEEKSRPLRTKTKLSPEHMLQWIVYHQSESWERATEYGSSHYPPGMEDMVVRYVKHLVRMSLNRNSFYVTLAITRLLYDYTTHEARFMYDVLTASDSARMKDIGYLRKQKAKLMDETQIRFDRMLHAERAAQGEKRFEPQLTTDRLAYLVGECLRRFTPWGTICVVHPGFDPIAIRDLYFSESGSADEDRVEMNRIHTILHPECFSRFVFGLSEFIQRLPLESPDKGCSYDRPDERLAVPHFRNTNDETALGDRFAPPPLSSDDYQRLKRTREALRSRRKVFQARQLSVYVDDVERAAFEPKQRSRIQLEIDPDAALVEVRGDDSQGEFLLAALIICRDDISSARSLKDWIVLEGGQKVTIQLKAIRNSTGDVEAVSLEVAYAETRLLRAVTWYAERIAYRFTSKNKHRRRRSDGVGASFPALWQFGIVVFIVVSALLVIWLQVRSTSPAPAPGNEIAQPPVVESPPPQPPSVTPPEQPPIVSQGSRAIVATSWNLDARTARDAIRLETQRGEPAKVELLRNQRSLKVAVPRTDSNNQPYVDYRITLVEADKTTWMRTMRPPQRITAAYANVLDLSLSSEFRPKEGTFTLLFEGRTQTGWQPLGTLRVQLTRR